MYVVIDIYEKYEEKKRRKSTIPYNTRLVCYVGHVIAIPSNQLFFFFLMALFFFSPFSILEIVWDAG